MVIGRCEHIDGIEEVEPVGVAGKVEGQLVGLGKIAIGIEALRQRTGNERAAVHLGVIGQIHAYIDGIATVHGIADGIALGLLSRLQRNAGSATKGYGGVTHKHLREGYRFGACKIGETETQGATGKRHAYGITQRKILGIHGLATVGNRGGVAPAGHPF